MRTTGIARRLHTELARRIRGQKIALHDAVADDLSALGAHTLFVKRRRAHSTRRMRIFDNLNIRPKDRRAQRIGQESRFTVQGTARYCLYKRAQQSSCQRRFEQDRTFARIELARIQARERALGSITTDGFRLGQLGGRRRESDRLECELA